MKKHTEILKMSDLRTKRETFEPYGLFCKLYKAEVMPCFDRHNEIEINYVMEGSVTYFVQNRRIVVSSRRIVLFWGIFPHRVIEVEENSTYYVCTIPLALFLSWTLPESFVGRVLKGDVLMYGDVQKQYADFDRLLLDRWRADLAAPVPDTRAMVLEIQSRLIRMATHVAEGKVSGYFAQVGDMNLVEQMVLYIARNYHCSIRVADVGRAVGVHPDYANTMFKKVFGHTLSYHLMLERITQAQRKLLTTSDTIVQISEACGFNSLSCFNSAFLKFNGCTPRDYRKHFIG